MRWTCLTADWKEHNIAVSVPSAPREGGRENKWSKITLLSLLGAELVLLTSPDTVCNIDLGAP